MSGNKKKKKNENSKRIKKEDVKLEEAIVKEEKIKDDDDVVIHEKKVSKNKKAKATFNLIEVIIIMVITILFGLLIGSFITYTKFDEDRDVSCSGIRKDMVEFAGVYDALLNEYYGEVNKEELLKAAINGMITQLNDPYSGYMEVEDAKLYDEELAGEFFGIGVEITLFEGGLPTITAVYEGSPASKAGLQLNDIFYKIDGHDLNGLTVTESSEFIKGKPKGSNVELVIIRDGEEKIVNIKTDRIEVDTVFGNTVVRDDEKIGIITIDTFAKNTYNQFKKIYNDMKDDGITGIIIDVRGNNGGYLSVAKEIASLFLDKDAVIYQKDTKGKIEKYLSETDKEIDLPVVLVTNECTASASEVLVAALNENLGSKIVGSTTYGKGTIQKLHALSNGAYVKYTVQTWLTPNGNKVDGVGIVPTYFVEVSQDCLNNPTFDNDNQMQEALNMFFD